MHPHIDRHSGNANSAQRSGSPSPRSKMQLSLSTGPQDKDARGIHTGFLGQIRGAQDRREEAIISAAPNLTVNSSDG